jgi:hypothetical protein
MRTQVVHERRASNQPQRSALLNSQQGIKVKMLDGEWALLILDMIGGGALIAALIAAVITLWHRAARHRKQRF